MSAEKKVLVAVLVVVGLLVAFLFSTEVVEKEIAPKPKAAWVAVEVASTGHARTGLIDIESGTPFRLHAVVEAETFSGDTIFYTEASSLEIDGEKIPPESLRVWSRSVEPRILWFTVEGFKPFMEVVTEAELEEFRFQDNFRADWPRSWSVPGDLSPRGERALKSRPVEGLGRFGTQRYHVRVEFFSPKSEITPELRLQSLNASDLPAEIDRLTTVRCTLPKGLALASSVYGLSQIEPLPEAMASVSQQLANWYDERVSFSRLLLLRDMVGAIGTTYGDLEWLAVELSASQAWGEEGVQAGDLLRVGNRWLILLKDQVNRGVLDREDLGLDFDKGARIRQIGEVFTGEGLVEWARLEPSEGRADG